MRLLIIGGTVFLGRHIVEAALARGHELTLFNRGQHNPELFPEVEKLRGDRDGNLVALEGRTWDAVIDTSGYVPRVVRQSAELLADRTGHYTFISTISVYPEDAPPGTAENGPLVSMEDESVEEITEETYGPLKVLCERVVQETLPDRALIIRPGLIVGPNDPTDRFTYWPVRVARDGTVLAPGRPEREIQFIDVRDLAEWTVRLVESRTTGVFNANGPDYPLSMQDLLNACREASGSDAELVWVSERFLEENGGGPWIEMPLWVPEEELPGFFKFDVSKAISAGLTFRPAVETCRDTLAWAQTRPTDHQWRAGMDPEKEQDLLAKAQA
jgi:nucleoside-diphosphate-sugar epimerase